MTILGIDPGSRRVGYGVVDARSSTLAFVDAGILPITSGGNQEALRSIREGLGSLIAKYQPDLCVVERLFFSKNRSTGMHVAEARGIIMLVVHDAGVRTLELTPNEVKVGITGFGNADKRAVAKMVRLLLKTPALSAIDDATDALALAIVGHQRARIENSLS